MFVLGSEAPVEEVDRGVTRQVLGHDPGLMMVRVTFAAGAAGHLLYAIGWAYDLLHADFTAAERARIRASLERHAALVYEAFFPGPGKRLNFTQNHDFIPTSGLAVTALAL